MSQEFKFLKSTDSLPDTPYMKAPKELVFGDKYSNLSVFAKYLVIIMLERLELSIKNNWADKDGNIYILFSQRDAMELLSCSETKVKRVFDELCKAGLICKKRQGLCKPDLIYINPQMWITPSEKDIPECTDETPLKDFDDNSGQVKKSFQDRLETVSNKNNNIKNKYIYNNHINQSYYESNEEWIEDRKECKEVIEDIISYNYLLGSCDKGVIDNIVSCVVNTLCSGKDAIKIGGEYIPMAEVKRRLYSLDVNHVEYIHDKLKENRYNIHNPEAYLITAIYKAADTINIGYI